MYNKPLALLVLGAVISTSSYSSGFLQKILPASKHQNSKMMVSKTEPKTSTGTNFSGTWVGSCSSDDMEIALTIENTDYSILLQDNYYDINSMISEGSAHANWYENNQFRFTWNSNMDVLSVNGIGIDNHSSDPSFNVDVYEISFSMKNDQLITKGKVKAFKNSKITENLVDICTFKRQVN